MSRHFLDQHRTLRVHSAPVGIEAAHHAVVIRANHNRSQGIRTCSGNIGCMHRTESAAVIQHLGQHQRGLSLQFLQTLQQALVILRNQKLIGAFRQRDVQTEHGRPGFCHRVQKLAQMRMPQGKGFFQRFGCIFIDTDDDHIVLQTMHVVFMHLGELPVQ